MEEDLKILREIKQNNESKAMIIHNNTSNLQITWSNEDLKNMAEIQHRCARENRAIDNLIQSYKKQEEENKELNIQFKELDKECNRLEKKEYDKEDKYLVRIKKLEEENKELKNDISNMYDEKIVRNILEELGLSKMEIEEILN